MLLCLCLLKEQQLLHHHPQQQISHGQALADAAAAGWQAAM
jgi:hypothetical protein